MSTPYAISLAGGGCRTVWGMGVVTALGLTDPVEWSGVSAGSAMALIGALGRQDMAIEHFKLATEANPSNLHMGKLLRGHRPFPHEGMYRTTLRAVLADGGLEALADAPPVRVLLAYIHPREPTLRRTVGALRIYRQRKKSGEMHGPDVPPPGMGAEVATLQNEPGAAAIVDRILESSATWPVTAVRRRAGRLYVDGGLIDNVPVRALAPEARAGKVISVLSRPAICHPSPANRLYIAPAEPLPVKKWDYASPARLQATWEAGLRAGERHRAEVQAFLAR